jgi:histidine triad (HIT) family protein
MSEDFYCEEVLSGRTLVQKVLETDNVLAYHHTLPFYPVHIVTIPKKHISSLISLEYGDNELLIELMDIVKKVASQVVSEYGDKRI